MYVCMYVQLEALRGTILEDSIPSGTKTGTSKGLPPREVIDYISQGEFHVTCLKVGKQEKKVCLFKNDRPIRL